MPDWNGISQTNLKTLRHFQTFWKEIFLHKSGPQAPYPQPALSPKGAPRSVVSTEELGGPGELGPEHTAQVCQVCRALGHLAEPWHRQAEHKGCCHHPSAEGLSPASHTAKSTPHTAQTCGWETNIQAASTAFAENNTDPRGITSAKASQRCLCTHKDVETQIFSWHKSPSPCCREQQLCWLSLLRSEPRNTHNERQAHISLPAFRGRCSCHHTLATLSWSCSRTSI